MNARGSRRRDSAEVRFSRSIIPVTESGCWLWLGTVSRFGYGILSVCGKNVRAHRYSLELSLGRKIESGLFVCHKCDVRCCVNPDHLYEGTILDNASDAVRRGRQACGARLRDSIKRRYVGEQNYAAKLTAEQIAEIRASTGTHREIASRYPVTEQAIGRIRNSKQWRHEYVQSP